MKIYKDLFNVIISPENLFSAWDGFKRGKRHKKDVQLFEWNLEENIFRLHRELKAKTYRHSGYYSFRIYDPKLRNIEKAHVRDRIIHHAVFQVLNPIFEAGFISSSFSCREGYGTHKGVRHLQQSVRKASENGTKKCFALKCDVRKFFDTIDHEVLIAMLERKIKDDDAIWILKEVIASFSSLYSVPVRKKGVPIGNLTSQLFANVYMNEFDQFMKQELKVQYYLRYTDDFLIVSRDKNYLKELIPQIIAFLGKKLALNIHDQKTTIRKTSQGIDFLGYVVFNEYALPRQRTKRRMLRKLRMRIGQYQSGAIKKESLLQSLNSYLGFLSHANAYIVEQQFCRETLHVVDHDQD